VDEPGDQVALDASARGAPALLEHLRGCDVCLREVVRHLYADKRVDGPSIVLCEVGAQLLANTQEAYHTYLVSPPLPP
jgi:hypothetical protein